MLAFVAALALLLGCPSTGVSGVSAAPAHNIHLARRMTADEFQEQGVWGPTAVWYWRCQSPFLVETSADLENWQPSSTCVSGTCCSKLADSPLCSKDACRLVAQEPGKEGQDPFALLLDQTTGPAEDRG